MEPQVHARMKNQKEIRVSRPFHDSGIRAFGLWAQHQDWHEILDTNGIQDKVDMFYNMLDEAINECFPVKKSKLHVNNKPWLTDRIKNLILERQKAYNSNNQTLWRKLRNQVQQEIKRAKMSYHANRLGIYRKLNLKNGTSKLKLLSTPVKPSSVWTSQVLMILTSRAKQMQLTLNLPRFQRDWTL